MSEINLSEWEISDESSEGFVEIVSKQTGNSLQINDSGVISTTTGLDMDLFDGESPDAFVETSPSFNAGGNYIEGPAPGEVSSNNLQFTTQFIDCTLLPPPDGRVVFSPSGSGNVGLFDPSDNTYTSGPAHGESTGGMFSSGGAFGRSLLLPDGRVMFSANQSGSIGLFDPSDNTYTSGPTDAGGQILSLRDGRVAIIDGFTNNEIRIFDPSDDTVSVATSLSPDLEGANESIVIPDGRVLIVESLTGPPDFEDSNKVGFFDPTDNSISTETLSNINGETRPLVGGAIGIAGEKILGVRGRSICKIDIKNLSYTKEDIDVSELPPSASGFFEFNDIVALNDGTFLFVPSRMDFAVIYDAALGAYTAAIPYPNYSDAMFGSFYGSVSLPDGRVIMPPASHEYIGIIYPIFENKFASLSNY